MRIYSIKTVIVWTVSFVFVVSCVWIRTKSVVIVGEKEVDERNRTAFRRMPRKADLTTDRNHEN